MDIILDSNMYLSDIRMDSIRFKNLFDYLRRTRSLLVIPRLVREEVVAGYVRMLEQQTKKTMESIRAFNRLALTSSDEISIRSPELKYKVRDLRKKLRAPAKKITPLLYTDVSGIDVNEIFLRGIKRKRPASDVGEELRDVILWLVVLKYANSEHKDVAFITADKGFWSAEEVHDHIAQDIAKCAGQVALFRTIEDFIRSRSPTSKSIDQAEVSTFFDIHLAAEGITNRATEALSSWSGRYRGFVAYGTVRSARLTSADLLEATLYEITPNASVAELSYAITVVAEIDSPREDFSTLFNRMTLANEQANLRARFNSYVPLGHPPSLFGALAAAQEPLFGTGSPPVARDIRSYVANGEVSDFGTLNWPSSAV